MTDKVKSMLEALTRREHRQLRRPAGEIELCGCATLDKYMKDFKALTDLDVPLIFENDDFGFNRGIDLRLPWGTGNVTPNYYNVICRGLDAIHDQIKAALANTRDPRKLAYGTAMTECIDICFKVCNRVKDAAREAGNTKLYNVLLKIPHKGAETFYEACVFLKLCIYLLRWGYTDHLGLGRFDQYMYPFYRSDKERGVSEAELLETLEAFFISLNYDTDLYCGIQQGDNGQSMVLGGFDKDGNSMFNPLSELCLQASLELSVIDPKINLRVGKNTPDEIYEYATLLTKQGLGFPQYCNDDVVVPGLIKLGYAPDDALNYTVAACWEFIIPGCGADIPNIQTMDFPLVTDRAIKKNLLTYKSFDALIEHVKSEISRECTRLTSESNEHVSPFNPLLSIFTDGCISSLTDLWHGGTKYNNFGCHGAGISTAADPLAAIKKNVFDSNAVSKQELLDALHKNFEGCEDLRNLLRGSPKMGNNDDFTDSIACELMDAFSKNMNRRKNGRGGIWRAGTGSAQGYVFNARNCPATADGRKAFAPYSSSFSPAPDAKTAGLLSVLQSFTKYDLTNIINGGPLTVEIHDTVLRNDIGIKKTAQLVKTFTLLGGHQLQLNSINRERLEDAQKHPENYPNLIVRVWGWSGYFNELDTEFQNHIINRTEYM